MPKFTSKTGNKKLKYKADAAEAARYCDDLESRVDHTTRMTLHDTDQRIWRLEKYTLEELKLPGVRGSGNSDQMWPSFTSNTPRTYWNAVRHSATSQPVRMRVSLPAMPDEGDTDMFEAMLKEVDRHEHFAYGVWQEIDDARVRRGEMPFQHAAAYPLAIRGGVFIRPWYNPDARTPFDCPIWDPMTVAYEVGDNGLSYVCNHYKLPFYRAMDRYPKLYEDPNLADKMARDEANNVECYDIWWQEVDATGNSHIWNTVMIGDCEALEAREHRDLDHIPVYLVRTFGNDTSTPVDQTDVLRNTLDSWETIYTANRNIYPWINRVTTLYGLYLRQHAIGPWFATGTGMNQEQLNNMLRPFSIVGVPRPDANIRPLSPAQMAPEVKEFFNHLQNMDQRGSVPFSVFGQLQMELSGFAVNQLQGAVSIVANPMARAMATVYRLATDEFFQQFRKHGRGSYTMRGTDTRRRQFIEDIKRAELRDKYYLEVEAKPTLPLDQLQTAQVAESWKRIGIDMFTILDEVLKVDSPREVMRRSVAWAALQQELMMEQAAKQQQQNPQLPSPQIASPETMGITDQHTEFQPSMQHMPQEMLQSAGMGGGGGGAGY